MGQVVTTDHGICVVERSSSRAGVYVGMTRGRKVNQALVLDRTGKADAKEELAAIIARPAHRLTAHMVRDQLYRAAGMEPESPTRKAPVASLPVVEPVAVEPTVAELPRKVLKRRPLSRR
ncbi:MAG: hypothetical protein ACRD0Q_10905 [Acidimicrobiales bacterium]